MPRPLTVKYERSYPLVQGQREVISVTLAVEAGDTVEGAMDQARGIVEAARDGNQVARGKAVA